MSHGTPRGYFKKTGALTSQSVNLVQNPHSGLQDGFGRLRVSSPITIFNDKHLYAKNDGTNGVRVWDYDLTGSGTATYKTNESAVDLTVTTADNDKVVKRSVRHLQYIPAQSHLIIMTAVLGVGEVGILKKIGMFNDEDGVFFTELAGVPGVASRTSTSGSAVTTNVVQSSWNTDKMDGTGPSGITLDFTKMQVFVIYFQWLGAGRISFGFDIGGVFYQCHQLLNANSGTVPYMKTPNLPVTYEIENDGGSTASHTLKTVCASVVSEGVIHPTGTTYSVGHNGTLRTSLTTTRTPVLAVRLKSTYESKTNHVSCRIREMSNYAENQSILFQLVLVEEPSTVTATWADVSAGRSACEVSTDVTAVSGGTEHVIDQIIIPQDQKGDVITTEIENIQDHYHWLSADFDGTSNKYFVIFAKTLSGSNGSAHASMNWEEIC